MGRGQAIDRYYIDQFLAKRIRNILPATCLKLAITHTYTQKFGHDVSHSVVMNGNHAVVEDLTDISTLPKEKFGCIIATQTLNFIFDVSKAIDGIAYLLEDTGAALITVAGISQIWRFDMDRWGDYWRFTDKSLKKLFEDKGFVIEYMETYGNCLVATSFIRGMSARELSRKQLDYKDRDYLLTICCVVKKGF